MSSNDLTNLSNSELNIFMYLIEGSADKKQIELEMFYSDRTVDKAIKTLLERNLIFYIKKKHEKTFKKIYHVYEE